MDPRLEQAYAAWLAGEDDGTFAELCEDPATFACLQRGLGDLEALGLAGGDEADALPHRVDGYELERVLGRGGMGIVYAARRAGGARCAIKFLRPTLTVFPESRVRFLREVDLMAGLDHSGIVRVLDYGNADGAPWFAMERLDGVALDRVVAAAGPNATAADFAVAAGMTSPPASTWESCCLFLAEQVAAAVAHAHARGIVHRDLKPGNVMITPEGRVVVLDFGLAHAAASTATSVTTTAAALGSLPYMAPERITQPERGPAPSGDVYAMGVLLYELCSGRRPFVAADRVALERAVVGAVAPDLHRVAPFVARSTSAICATAMRPRPERRYVDAGALCADLQRAIAGQPVVARATSLAARGLRGLRARPWKVGATALLLTVGLAFASLSWQEAHAEEKQGEVERVLREQIEAAPAPEVYATAENAARWLRAASSTIQSWLPDQGVVQARLLRSLGDSMSNLGFRSEALAVYDRARAAAVEASDDYLVARVDERRAMALWNLGRLEAALAVAKQAAAWFEANGHTADLGICRYDEAAILAHMGDTAGAEAAIRVCLEAFRSEASVSAAQEAKAQVLLGSVLHELGRLGEAAVELEAAVDGLRLAGPKMERDLGLALGFLGDCRWASGDVGAGIALFEEAEALQLRVLPKDHVDFVASWTRLASASIHRRDFDGARALYRRALELADKRALKEAANLRVKFARAEIYSKDWQHAEELLQEAVGALAERGAKSLVLLEQARFDLAHVRFRRGDDAGATEVLEGLVERATAAGGLSRRALVDCHYLVGRIADRQRKVRASADAYQRAWSLGVQVLPPADVTLPRIALRLAQALDLCGTPAELCASLDAELSRSGRDPAAQVQTAWMALMLGQTRLELEERGPARAALARAVELRVALEPQGIPGSIVTALAACASEAEESSDDSRLAQLSAAAKDCAADGGKGRPFDSAAALLLGQTLLAAGREAEAVPHFERSVAMREKAYGHKHWRTAHAEGWLGAALRRTGGDEERAGALLQRAADGLEAALGEAAPLARAARARLR